MKKGVLKQSYTGSSWKKPEWIIGISAALLIIGAFLTWVKSNLVSGAIQTDVVAITGIATKAGYITAAAGLIIFVILFMKKTPKISAMILGGISTLIGGGYWYYIKYVPKQFIEIQGEVGVGAIITTFAGIILIVGGFLARRK